MVDFPKVKVGDRVRVVIESQVAIVDGSGLTTEHNGFDYNQSDVVSVEVLAPPVKVGDILTTEEQLDALPSGTVVRGVQSYPQRPAYKSEGGWYFAGNVREYPTSFIVKGGHQKVLALGWR